MFFLALRDRKDDLDCEKNRLARKIKLTAKIISWIEGSDETEQWKNLLIQYEKHRKDMEIELTHIEEQAKSAGSMFG